MSGRPATKCWTRPSRNWSRKPRRTAKPAGEIMASGGGYPRRRAHGGGKPRRSLFEKTHMVRRGIVIAPMLLAAALCAGPPSTIPADTLPETLSLDAVPLGLGQRPAANDNPLTAARVALGRRLFFDPI